MGWMDRGFRFALGWALGRVVVWVAWIGLLLIVGWALSLQGR